MSGEEVRGTANVSNHPKGVEVRALYRTLKIWQAFFFFSLFAKGKCLAAMLVPVKRNVTLYSIQRHPRELCGSTFVATVWGRTTHGCDPLVSRCFLANTVLLILFVP